MAYPHNFTKLTFGGTMAGGAEIWTCGVSLAPAVPAIEPDAIWKGQMEAHLPQWRQSVIDFISRSDSNVPSGVVLEWLKLAHIGTDGKYIGEPVEATNLATQGAVSRGYLPQIANVVTLASSKWRDPGKYNRFYLPTVAPDSGNQYSLSETEQENLLASSGLFIKELNDAGGGFIDSLYRVVAASANTDEMLDIEYLRVGRIIDTQRRRRNALPEQYQVLALSEIEDDPLS